jgi:molybdate transport system substrate-binding protein
MTRARAFTLPAMMAVATLALGACPPSSSSPSSSSPSPSSSPTTTPLQVAAAADLAVAMPALVAGFGSTGGGEVVVTTGASGQLAMQLKAGAPYDVFLAANEAFVDDVVRAGACSASSQAVYARGRLALVSRTGLTPPVETVRALGDARLVKIGIAHPAHAPYGQAARAALVAAGVWNTVEPRLVLGDNVRQALQLVESGNVDAALVSHALVGDSGLAVRAVDEILHPPLRQALAVCGDDHVDEATAFARFVRSSAGQAILARHGVAPPPATTPTTTPTTTSTTATAGATP